MPDPILTSEKKKKKNNAQHFEDSNLEQFDIGIWQISLSHMCKK